MFTGMGHTYVTIRVMQFPLSNDEHAAMARYLSGIKKQLQDVSDLFRTRYGKGSEIAEETVRTLAAIVRLERRFLRVNETSRDEELAIVNK
jgi:hypothetical protein